MKAIITLLLFTSLAYGQDSFYFRAARQAESCTPLANNLLTTASAFSDPNCNEANGTGNFIAFGSVTQSVETVDTDTGQYAYKILSDDGGTGFSYNPITITTGQELRVTIKFKRVGAAANFFISTTGGIGITNNGSIDIGTSITTHQFDTDVTTGGSAQFRFYPARSNGAGDTGDYILIYEFSVEILNP